MTNSTTPLPVQEPAGAVEAIMALADAYAEAAQRGEDAMSIARKCSALRSALASLPPVTQAQPDASIPGPGMNASGERVDSANVTQAKSEAVAVVQRGAQTPWGFAGVLVSWEPGLQDLPPGKHPLYAAPQEAVERQPLTGWQPIETAPKTLYPFDERKSFGTYVLVYEGGEVKRARWWEQTSTGANNWISDGGLAIFPTHWMPLPPAPDRGLRIAEKGDAS